MHTRLIAALAPRAAVLQNVPRFNDPHKLMWHLWHYPQGPADDVLEVGAATNLAMPAP